MVMTKDYAEGAVKALRETKNSVFFELIKANQHSMEKHFSKETAKAGAVGNVAQGYFKASYEIHVGDGEAFNKLTENKQTAVKKLLNNPKGAQKLRMALGRYNQKHAETGGLKVSKTKATNASAILDIVHMVLTDCEVRENNVDPNARFLAVAPVPPGFVGRSITAVGTKSKNLDHAVVVINAPQGGSPAVVTVFPADDAYVNGRPLLT